MFVLIFKLLLILLLSLADGGGDGGGGGGGGGGSGEDIDVLLINPLLRFIGDEDVRVDAVVDRLIADIVANPKLSPVADDDSDGDDGSGCLIVAGNKSNISNVFKSVEFKILNLFFFLHCLFFLMILQSLVVLMVNYLHSFYVYY